jgi:hypothetical protein
MCIPDTGSVPDSVFDTPHGSSRGIRGSSRGLAMAILIATVEAPLSPSVTFLKDRVIWEFSIIG